MTGRKADCIMAARLASEAALRLVQPGNEVQGHTGTFRLVLIYYLFYLE